MNDAPVDDGRPPAEPAVERQVAVAEAASPIRRRRWPAVVLWLVVVAVLAGAGYFAWRQLEAAQAALGRHVDALAAEAEGMRAELRAANRRLDAELAPRLDALERQAADLEAAQHRAAGAPEPWDVEGLLRIANDRLFLAHDPRTALEALRRADERLSAVDDPAYAETRRRLAHDIATLEAVPKPDVAGAAFELATLESRLEALAPDRVRAAPAATPVPAEGEASGWRAVLRRWWHSIRSLVVIRRTQAPPLLAPEQRVFLLQNLRLKLEAARLALLARDDANYHISLQAAKDWIVRYYDTEDPAASGMVDRLAELDRLDIRPQTPDISGSLEALRAALGRRRPDDGRAMGGSPARP
jgi:uroporphyrin-3 C-methyltransferase